MELDFVKDSFERVAKKQKLSSSKSQELIDQVGNEIKKALTRIQSDYASASTDQEPILVELKAKLTNIAPNNHLERSLKELNIDLSKYQKIIEKTCHPDISKASRNIDFDCHILINIIISHLYREGRFDIADCLINEAGEPADASYMRSQFEEMHQILEAVSSKNLDPAINWAATNSQKLKEFGSYLELKLHKLKFLEILQSRGRSDALSYAKVCLAPFASLHMNEIQKLIGSILWAGRLEKSPYSDLTAPTQWETLSEELMQQLCNFMGQSLLSPLSVALAAGVQGLPTLLKLANVIAAKKQEWQVMKQLPVEVEVGKEFQFHSVFVCPVSREQGSQENPAMLLPCGHVLCKQSINMLSKGNNWNFKCPYCPLGTSVSQCKQLYF